MLYYGARRRNGVEIWRPLRDYGVLGAFAKYNLFNVVRMDATLLACGSEDNSVRVFRVELDDEERIKPYVLAAHKASIVRCFFVGSTIASCARDCVVAFWELDNGVSSLATKGASGRTRTMASSEGMMGDSSTRRPSSTLLACAFSTGVFAVYDTSGKHRCACVHRLSVARGSVDAISIDSTGGSRIALASQRFGQLVVWDWRAETFVLKQQGHDHAATCCAWSPDGRLCISGADDRRVKVWSDSSGFCFATFSDHQAPVTAVACARNVVFSASRDGTVRARMISEGTANSESSRRRRLEPRPTSRARRSRARPSFR